jgi:hypothetical protein
MAKQQVDEYLQAVIQLSKQMIDLAYQGDACRQDVGCGVVFGSLRDKAYKVRRLAEDELRKHQDTAGAGAAGAGAAAVATVGAAAGAAMGTAADTATARGGDGAPGGDDSNENTRESGENHE